MLNNITFKNQHQPQDPMACPQQSLYTQLIIPMRKCGHCWQNVWQLQQRSMSIIICWNTYSEWHPVENYNKKNLRPFCELQMMAVELQHTMHIMSHLTTSNQTNHQLAYCHHPYKHKRPVFPVPLSHFLLHLLQGNLILIWNT